MLSLRYKILFPLFMVLAVGFYLLGAISLTSINNSLEDNIAQSVEREGHLIFSSIDRMLINAENNLWAMQEEGIVVQFAHEPVKYRGAMEEALQKFARRLDLFHAVGFVSAEGYLLASSALPNADGKLFLGHQEHYVASLGGKVGVSGIFKSSTANPDGQYPPIIVVAVPVFDEGTIVGALFASLDITLFEKIFINSQSSSLHELHTLLLNKDFVPMVHPDPQMLFSRDGVDINALRTAQDYIPFQYVDKDVPTWGMRMTHPSGQLILGFIGPTEEVLAPLVVLRHTLLLAFAIIVSAVCLLSYRLLWWLLSRVTKVMQYAQKVSEGQLDQSIPDKHQDELGLLATSVERMVHSLAEMVDKAEASSKSKSEFLARMSHEIRTPMNAIMGMVHLCLQTQLTGQQKSYLQKVETACKNLLSIINDVLDFSKIEAGKLSIDPVQFSLGTMLATLEDMMGIKAAEKNLYFNVQRDLAVPDRIIGGEGRLLQILINLCGNALKFTEQGGVTLSVSVSQQDDLGCELLFSIKDTGIGIAKEDQEHIFQPFEQAEGSAVRRFEGTGLGLAISKRLVELMGGIIGLRSKIGAGCEFYFTAQFLKPAESEQPSCFESTCTDTGRLQGLKVLLVEDNLINQEIASEMLMSFGITVEVANNGCEALERANAVSYDIILMDIAMPIMDGIQATEKIRTGGGPNSQKTPVIALTAHAFAEDREKSRNAGMNDYITKPIDYLELAQKLLLHARVK